MPASGVSACQWCVCLPGVCLPARGVSAYRGCVCLPGVCLPGGVSAYQGLSASQGVSAREGVNNKELISIVKRILKLFNPFNHPLYFTLLTSLTRDD